jgi:hypothetical protein
MLIGNYTGKSIQIDFRKFKPFNSRCLIHRIWLPFVIISPLKWLSNAMNCSCLFFGVYDNTVVILSRRRRISSFSLPSDSSSLRSSEWRKHPVILSAVKDLVFLLSQGILRTFGAQNDRNE